MTDRDDGSVPDDEPVPVPRQVHCELETLRQLGGVDPFSPAILDTLEAYDFYAARRWAIENPERYVRSVEAGTRDETLEGPPADVL